MLTNVGKTFEMLLQAPPHEQVRIQNILYGRESSDDKAGPLLLNNTDAAKRLGLSRATLYRLVADGKIPRVEIRRGTFRIRSTDLDRFVSANVKEAA